MADASITFDPSSYLPPAIASDVQTGIGYYNQLKTVLQGATVGPHGSIHISDQQQAAIENAMITVIAQVVPILGQIFGVLMAIAPKAGPGPGVCATDPPPTAKPSDLVNWAHFQPWTGTFPTYSPGPTGSFEAFANPLLEYNWLLLANCLSDSPGYAPSPVLLATLVASWNASHGGPKRTITRKGLNPSGWGFAPGYDPIANALETAAIGKLMPANLNFSQYVSATSSLPHNLTASVAINNGPAVTAHPASPAAKVVHVLALTLPHLAKAVTAKTGAPPAVAKVAIKKVLALHLAPSPAAKAAAAAPLAAASPASQTLLGAAQAAIVRAPAFWVAYYASMAQSAPLPPSHPFAATILRDLARVVP